MSDGKLTEHGATRDDLTTMLQLGVVTPPRLGTLLRQTLGSPPLPLATATLSDSSESVSHVEATMAAPQ